MSEVVAARSAGLPTTMRLVIATGTAVASLGAAGIHAWVVPDHLREYWLFGSFFIVVAAGQLVWAAAVMRWPNRTTFLLGAVASALLIGVWAMSRTVGLLLGPEQWEPESAGVLDGVCVLLESAIIVLAAMPIRVRRPMQMSGTAY